MKNKLFISSLFILALILALNLNMVSATACNPTIRLVSQDPSPAIPNDYVKVLFEVSDLGNCQGFTLRLDPEYPFSLDSNSSTIQSIEAIPYASDYRSVWTVPYKLRIDSAAFDGDYNLRIDAYESNREDFGFNLQKNFNVTIQDSRTDFDAVIQETSGNAISIAIANIGKYAANSVVVRIPEQDFFIATGTDGQMVGNLNSGDYTIVGFNLAQKFSKNMTRDMMPSNYSQTTPQKPNLKFDIYYTDNIGKRRIVNMELPLNLGNSSAGMTRFTGRARSSSTSWFSSWIFWVIIIMLAIVGYVFYRKNSEKVKKLSDKIRNIFHKKHKSDNQTPNWIKNSKNKEKSK